MSWPLSPSVLRDVGLDVRMDVYWLEQSHEDVPDANHWLSAEEAQTLAGLRFLKRRSDWRLGRWTAKRTVAALLDLPSDPHSLSEIEITSAPSGAPEVSLFRRREPMTISLSHSDGAAMCAVSLREAGLGCDLEMIEPRSDAFVEDYFTREEQTLVKRAPQKERPLLSTLLWSAKESALKALRVGLRLDTNCLEVRLVDVPPPELQDWRRGLRLISLRAPEPECWHPLQVCLRGAPTFFGWWRDADDMVRSVVFDCTEPLRKVS